MRCERASFLQMVVGSQVRLVVGRDNSVESKGIGYGSPVMGWMD